MTQTMEIKGFNSTCFNNSIELALKKADRKLARKRRLSWPRVKGPRALRIHVDTGFAVAFV